MTPGGADDGAPYPVETGGKLAKIGDGPCDSPGANAGGQVGDLGGTPTLPIRRCPSEGVSLQ
jgi:hypothetical protein